MNTDPGAVRYTPPPYTSDKIYLAVILILVEMICLLIIKWKPLFLEGSYVFRVNCCDIFREFSFIYHVNNVLDVH